MGRYIVFGRVAMRLRKLNAKPILAILKYNLDYVHRLNVLSHFGWHSVHKT